MLAAAVVFVGVGVAGWRSLPPHIRGLDLLDAAAVLLVLAPATTILNGLEFAATARLVGQRPSVPESVRIAVLGTAANLLPLPGAALVRIAAMRRAGAGVGRSTAASATAALLWAAGVAGLAGAVLAVGHPLLGAVLLVGGALTAVVGVAAGRRVAHRSGVRDVGRPLGRLAAVEVGTGLVGALRLLVVGAGLGGGIGFGQAAGLGLSSVLAAAAGVFPGGLGLREGISAGLAPILDLPAAVGAVAATFDRLLGLPVVIVAAVVLSRRTVD